MNAILVLMLMLSSIFGCASSHPALQATKHGLGARANAADLCELTVVNETPFTFKFRVGHLWWEEQSGLLPNTTTGDKPMLIEQDEEHVLVRVFSVNGLVMEDKYYFYVPKGVAKYTVTFGGLQYGAVINHSSYIFTVGTPAKTKLDGVLAPEDYVVNIPAPAGREVSITFFFQKKSWGNRWDKVVVTKNINDIHGDQEFIDPQGRKFFCDWLMVVDDRFFEENRPTYQDLSQ